MLSGTCADRPRSMERTVRACAVSSQTCSFSNLVKASLALMHAPRHFEQNGTKDPSSMSTQPLLIVRLPIQQIRSLFHPLNALWPVKCKSPILYLCLESELCLSLQISIRSQPNLFHSWINLYSLSQMKSLIHKPLSLITKTRIRGLDAFNLPLFGNWWQH